MVLVGNVTGVITSAVSQALLVETVQVSGADNAQGFRSDDRTQFRAVAEINTGDDYKVHLALVNESDDPLVGEMTLYAPEGITLSAKANDGASNVVRTSLTSWLFDLAANETDNIIDLTITVALNDEMPPMFVEVDGRLQQIDFQAMAGPSPTPTPVPMANLGITKMASPNPVLVGNQLTYTLNITNAGPTAAAGVTVTDILPSTVAFVSAAPTQGTCTGTSTVVCSLGAMGVSNTASIAIIVVPSTPGLIVNTATVVSATTDPVSADNTTTVTTVVTPLPTANLTIAKSDSPDPVVVGSPLTYTITVTNNGPDGAPGAVVTDVLPGSVILVSATPSQGACSGTTTLTCSLGILASGGSATVTIVVVPTTAGTITNTATATSSVTDPVTADNTTTVTTTVAPLPTANLSISKADSPDPVLVGSPLTYVITVTNGGPDAAPSVVVTDQLPAGVTFVSATPSQGACSGTSTVSCLLGTLANGGSATITIVVTPTAAGTIVNTATVVSSITDPVSANNTTTATTTVNLPVVADLSVAKVDSPDPATTCCPLTYTLTVSNAGPSAAANVVLTDVLPSSVAFVSCSPSQGTCSGTTTITCNLGTIASGGTATVTLIVAPLQPGVISNTATVTSSTADSNTNNNSATATTTVS